MRLALKLLGWLLVIVLGIAVGILLYWYLRPNDAHIEPSLEAKVWPVVQDGLHNSNTDLIYWNDAFYLIHARSRYHMGNDGTILVILRSPDAQIWTAVGQLNVEGEDIRDPKFAVIGEQLIAYGLKNTSFEPEPYGTVVSKSHDGLTWTPFEEIEPRGWLLWRPKTLDGETWYATAYWHEHGRSALLKSKDGVEWELVSTIHEGDRNDETALEFLPDGRMLITARLEGERAWHQGSQDAATLIGVAEPPYTDWNTTKSLVARLDGPALFAHNGRVYAVARFDPEGRDQWYATSSLLGRKRTALYEVTEKELVHISDLPSAGDTAYPGVVLKDGDLYTSYYSNDTTKDVSWLMGLVLPSDILMARINLDKLEALASEKR